MDQVTGHRPHPPQSREPPHGEPSQPEPSQPEPGHREGAFVARVPASTTSTRPLRTLISEALHLAGADSELVDDATLVLHELVVNGIEHGVHDEDGTIEVTWHVADDRVELAVRDFGSTLSQAVADRAAATDPMESVRGRGLTIVEALSEAWGVEDADGTRVWARLRGQPAPDLPAGAPDTPADRAGVA